MHRNNEYTTDVHSRQINSRFSPEDGVHSELMYRFMFDNSNVKSCNHGLYTAVSIKDFKIVLLLLETTR